MMDPNTFPVLDIPEGAFLMTWGKLRAIGALCFILGFYFNTLLEKLKQKDLKKQDQKGVTCKN